MGLLSHLFGKSPPPPPPPGFDAIWQPGEIAECIDGGGWYELPARAAASGPETGERFRVTRVEYAGHPLLGVKIAWLFFAPWPGAFPAVHFRKVVPQADAAEAADAAFLASLKPARIRTPVPVAVASRAHLHPLSADPLVRTYEELLR